MSRLTAGIGLRQLCRSLQPKADHDSLILSLLQGVSCERGRQWGAVAWARVLGPILCLGWRGAPASPRGCSALLLAQPCRRFERCWAPLSQSCLARCLGHPEDWGCVGTGERPPLLQLVWALSYTRVALWREARGSPSCRPGRWELPAKAQWLSSHAGEPAWEHVGGGVRACTDGSGCVVWPPECHRERVIRWPCWCSAGWAGWELARARVQVGCPQGDRAKRSLRV